MVALVDKVVLKVGQRVVGQFVFDAKRTFLESGFNIDFVKVLEVIRRLGHLPGRELGKQDFPFFFQVGAVHHPSAV
jgi:hypothetical protein